LPQIPAGLLVNNPERGKDIGAFTGVSAVNKRVSMHQALLQTDTPRVTTPLLSEIPSSEGLDSSDLQMLGERLQLTYGPIEVALPARLAELVERLVRREQSEE
jgi:hypothetical protein